MLKFVCNSPLLNSPDALVNYIKECSPSKVCLVFSNEWLLREVREELAHSIETPANSIFDWNELQSAVVAAESNSITIGETERCAILREILLSEPATFSLLVSNADAARPFVTHGIIRRIARIVGHIANGRTFHVTSPRGKQISELSKKYLSVLSEKGAIETETWFKTSCTELLPEQLLSRIGNPDKLILAGIRGLNSSIAALLNLIQKQIPVEIHCAELKRELCGSGWGSMLEAAQCEEIAPSRPDGFIRHTMVRRSPTRTSELRDMARAAAGISSGARCIICYPELSRHLPSIEFALKDFGLSYQVCTRKTLKSGPVWRLVESLRAAVAERSDLNSIRELLKNPIILKAPDAINICTIDELKSACYFTGTADDFLLRLEKLIEQIEAKQRREIADDDAPAITLAHLNHEAKAAHAYLEKLLNSIRPLAAKHNLGDWGEVLLSAILSFVQKTSASDDKSHDEHQEELSCLEKIIVRLKQISPLLTADKLSIWQYVAYLEIFAQNCDFIDSAPQQQIRIFRLEDAVGLSSDLLIIGGMVEGEFPRLFHQSEAWLTEFETPSPPEAQINRQRGVLKHVLSGSYQEILLTFADRDDDEELLPSQFLDDIVPSEVVHVPEKQLFSKVELECDLGAHLREIAGRVTQVRTEPFALASKTGQNIAWCTAANADRESADTMGMFDGFIRDAGACKYIGDFIDRHVWSPTQLDSLVQCRFRFFAERILRLREPEPVLDQISPLLIGEAAHRCLCRFYTRWKDAGFNLIRNEDRQVAAEYLWQEAISASGEQALPRIVEDQIRLRLVGLNDRESFISGITPPGGIRGNLGLLGAFLDLEMQRSAQNPNLLRPGFFEVAFGMEQEPLATEGTMLYAKEPVCVAMNGEKVKIRGRVDRVDLHNGFYAIIDYKTGRVPTITAQKEGYRTQIPVYLMALDQLFSDQGQFVTAAGGLYYALSPGTAEVTGRFLRESCRAMEAMPSRSRALSDEDFEAAMERVRWRIADGISGLRKGNACVTLADEKLACVYCSSSNICRKNLSRAQSLLPTILNGEVSDED
jgi:RecB family exonuclease